MEEEKKSAEESVEKAEKEEPITTANSTTTSTTTTTTTTTTKPESDVYNFLLGLKLEQYYHIFSENGADSLNQIIYIDDATIEQLCVACGMKIVHTGVFKKAIRECRLNNKSGHHYENADKATAGRPDQASNLACVVQYSHPSDQGVNVLDRRRMVYGHENSHYYTSPHNMVQLVSTGQSHDSATFYARPVQPNVEYPSTSRYQYSNEEQYVSASRTDADRKSGFSQDPVVQTTPKPLDSQPDQGSENSCYFVGINDRAVKFPASVHQLTLIEKIDQERRDIIRKGAQIFGRDDTKRKTAELAPLELFMNEIAYEVCLRDFTYMISRQRLLGLVREIVKENQIQLSAHHTNFMSHNYSASYNASNGKSRPDLKIKLNNFSDNNVEAFSANQEEANKTSSDYDIILFHKTNREWPPGVSKEKKKYLGRRASNFEVIDNMLYYSKDNKRRRWLANEQELNESFEKVHVDPNTGEHIGREVTFERMNSQFYCKNMNESVNRLLLNCDICRSKFSNYSGPSPYATRNNRQAHILVEDSQGVQSVPVVHAEQQDVFLQDITMARPSKRKSETAAEVAQHIKKSRKSTPHKLVVEPSVEFSEKKGDKQSPQPQEYSELQNANLRNQENGSRPSSSELSVDKDVALDIPIDATN